MTHKELLAKIDEKIESVESMSLIIAVSWRALHAVVKLHKPNEEGFCSACFVSVVHFPYPCPTIQAIEKELN